VTENNAAAVQAAQKAALRIVPERGYYGDRTGWTDQDREHVCYVAEIAVAAAEPILRARERERVAMELEAFTGADYRTAARLVRGMS